MAEYFVSMNPLVKLEENLPNLSSIEDPAVEQLSRSTRGVVMPRSATEQRYRKIAAMARDYFQNLDIRHAYYGKAKQALLFGRLKVRHPKTLVYPNPLVLMDGGRKAVPPKYPFVLKGDTGGGGELVCFPLLV